jgi:hypothetical protein
MKPTFIATFVIAVLAGQSLACANQGDACGGANLGKMVCGCNNRGNLVVHNVLPCNRVLTRISFNASKHRMGVTNGYFSRRIVNVSKESAKIEHGCRHARSDTIRNAELLDDVQKKSLAMLMYSESVRGVSVKLSAVV